MLTSCTHLILYLIIEILNDIMEKLGSNIILNNIADFTDLNIIWKIQQSAAFIK